MEALLPSKASLAHRESVRAALFRLRRLAPRVPFWQLAAHRRPTRWMLYRGLLRHAPSSSIRWRIRTLFRKYHHLTSPQRTREKLLLGHKWLDIFKQARNGDQHWQAVLWRYARMIDVKRSKERMAAKLEEELAWQNQLRNRPILTGGFMRPTELNAPLPRMKPQPIHVSMMMRRRRDTRERRIARTRLNAAWREDISSELGFEEHLADTVGEGGMERMFDTRAWDEPLDAHAQAMYQSRRNEEARSAMKYSPELIATVKQARREKIANKTREKERERRGEVLNHTVKRMRQGLPAHLISLRGKEGVFRDRMIKDPSEGGYAGFVKRRAGMKLKNDTRSLEEGISPEGKRLAKEFREANNCERPGDDPQTP